MIQAMFLFCFTSKNEAPFAAKKEAAKKFRVVTIKKVNNLKVKFMIPKLLEHILRSILINHT